MNTRIRTQGLTDQEIQRVAEDIYIYGYPLVLMDVAKRAQTATAHPAAHNAPLNQFAHERFPPRPHEKCVPHANADCLSSSAWLDLGREPVVLGIPRTDRYYLLSFFNDWYEIFETISLRTGTRKGGHVGFVSPQWLGKLPVAKLDARAFYSRLSRLMHRNPAEQCDAGIMAEFLRIGFFPCEDFAFEVLPPDTARNMYPAVEAAQLRIINAEKAAGSGKAVNNWLLQAYVDPNQKDYLGRAVSARSCVVSNMPEDILCFRTAVDDAGKPLSGANQYVINFPRDGAPPANAFWSITVYDARQHLVLSTVLRNTIGSRDRLRLNPDDSLTVHIQGEWPGFVEDSNWLPSPKDAFSLALRMYWPKQDALNGIWRPPLVRRSD